MTQAALDKAAELWAAVRNAGLTTAHPAVLDGDAILAAQTILPADASDVVTIATNNARHLSRFPEIDAQPWHRSRLIGPSTRPSGSMARKSEIRTLRPSPVRSSLWNVKKGVLKIVRRTTRADLASTDAALFGQTCEPLPGRVAHTFG